PRAGSRRDHPHRASDGDGLSDHDEVNIHPTAPHDFDTDGDGFSDGAELLAGTDPLDAGSVIDGIYVEVGERTEVEETFTFFLRIQRGDIALVTDTTCSMGGTITAVKAVFTKILTRAQEVFTDVAGGAGGFDDYVFGSMGSSPDKPFYLNTPITTDFSEVQDGVDMLTTHNGADGPESGYEAYYQAVSGAGYDQNC